MYMDINKEFELIKSGMVTLFEEENLSTHGTPFGIANCRGRSAHAGA